MRERASSKPLAPPATVLASTQSVAAVRLQGRPRDPSTGAHRQVVAFVRPELSPGRVASYLRELADLLEART